jgi:hypothetical protein
MLFLARWARRLSWKETAEAFRTSWEKVFDAVEYVVTFGLEHPSRRHPQPPVIFRWKDYAHGNRKRKITLTADEFLRRFLLHTLPRGFVRIRFFGFLANRRRAALLPLCRRLLDANPRQPVLLPPPKELCRPVAWLCPQCGGPMVIVERFTAQQICRMSAKVPYLDTS